MGNGDVGVCRSCGAPIVWGRTTNGRLIPVDRDPVDKGNIELGADGQVRIQSKPAVVALDGTVPVRYVSHYATCPDAADWRRRTDRGGKQPKAG